MNAHLAARAFAAYGRATGTMPPLEQIVMLYDGAMMRVREARAAIARQDVEARFRATSKAIAILEALQSCLDFAKGGEIARLLDRYYTYLILRLAAVNMRNDAAICEEILARLAEMRASWAQLAQTAPSLARQPEAEERQAARA